MSSSRESVIQAALELLRSDPPVPFTLDAVAKQAGLTRPGLMYYFHTKHALMKGVVSYVVEQWENQLLEHMPEGDDTIGNRFVSYVDVALEGLYDLSDASVYFDRKFSHLLQGLWTPKMNEWLAIPSSFSADDRGKLLTARLAADGYWFSCATGVLEPSESEIAGIRETLVGLISSAGEQQR